MADKKQLVEDGEMIDDDDDGVMTTPLLAEDKEVDWNDDKDLDVQFDDDGNFIGDEADEIEPPDEPFKDDMTPEPVVEPIPQAKANKAQLSPETIKLINVKKELAETQRINRELLETQRKQQLEQESQTQTAKLVEQGYDPDTAKRFVDLETKQKQQDEKIAKFDFMEDNQEVFDRYPQAKANVITIMNNVNLTGMTAEQICKGLYGTVEQPAYERRALESVKGNVAAANEKPNLNTARSNTAVDGLSAKDLAEKAWLERTFKEKLTVAEFLQYRK